MTASTLANRVAFIAASSGTGAFGFGSAINSFLTLQQAVAQGELTNGVAVSYIAQDNTISPTQAEWGQGTFSTAGLGSIARTTVYGTDNAGVVGSGSPLSFNVPPTILLTVLSQDIGGSTSITINSTPILSGTTTHVLYDNAGTIGEAANFTISSGNPNVTAGNAYLYGGSNALFEVTNGSGNNWFMAGGGNSSLSGNSNFAAGDGAGSNLSTGNQNICIGLGAGQNITSGGQNFALGKGALSRITGDSSNVAIGFNSQQGISSGSNNVSIGANTFAPFSGGVTCNQCVGIGSSALGSITGANVQNVTAIGYNSGASLTSGRENTFIGMNSGTSVTTGSRNTIIGEYAGSSGMNDSIAIATGGISQAGLLAWDYNITTSSIWTSPVSINITQGSGIAYQYGGGNAAFAVGTIGGGNESWFFGEAGNFTLTGNNNVGVGRGALGSVTTGPNNVAMGSGACAFVTTGQSNFGLGVNAMRAGTSSSQNVAVGTGALGTGGTYSSNVAVGHAALGGLSGGAGGNVAIGEGALQSATTVDSCVCIGEDAGFNLGTQTGETLIGNGAGFNISSGSNNTMIGGHPGVATMSNCVVFSAGAAIKLDYNFTTASIWTSSAAMTLGGYAVGSLPTSPTGTIAYVTDGTAGLVNGNTVTGGHATPYLVWFNGTNWTVVGE